MSSRPPRRPRHRLCKAVGLVWLGGVACAPPRASINVEGPAFSLRPSAAPAFDLTLCMDGPPRTVDEIYAHVELELTRVEGEGRALVRGWGPDPSQPPRTTELGAEPQVIAIVLDQEGPWSDRAGPRCAAPQRIRVEVSGDARTRLQVSWKALFTLVYSDRTCATDRLQPRDLSIQIEPVST